MAGKKTEIITERKGPHLMRSLLVDGALASWVTIIDHKIRIGRASMPMGGIGGVNTKVEHRRRGHMRRLMADSVRFMQERGYVFSMLFGIENFYQKFGYEVSLPEYRMTMQTRDAKRAGDLPFCRRYSVRLARPADFPTICLIHNRVNLRWPCAGERDPDTFNKFRKGVAWRTNPEAFVATNSRGKVVAYAVVDRTEREVPVAEMAADEMPAYAALLHKMSRLASRRRCGEIAVHVPPEHPFAHFSRRFGFEFSTQYHRAGGGMMRILDQQKFFKRLLPELKQRVKQRPPRRPGTLTIATDLGRTHLEVTQSGVRIKEKAGRSQNVLRLPQARLTQLVTGHRSLDDLLMEDGVKSRGSAAQIADILAPARAPYFWLADRF